MLFIILCIFVFAWVALVTGVVDIVKRLSYVKFTLTRPCSSYSSFLIERAGCVVSGVEQSMSVRFNCNDKRAVFRVGVG